MDGENAEGSARPEGSAPADGGSLSDLLRDRQNPARQPQGSLTAFDGRLILDLDTRIATVDGRAAQLTRADTKLLRGLIALGEGVHESRVIMWEVYNAPFHPRELRYPMAVLRAKLGEPSWIERTADGYALRPPARP
ncbi:MULTISPECIES: hypothetical protein [unclassified Kitasatospora]|uniref:hypothetical protein n=1 Tax=unclassified Kitasatospora TaxID=2633591 RepID=UPI0033CA44D7